MNTSLRVRFLISTAMLVATAGTLVRPWPEPPQPRTARTGAAGVDERLRRRIDEWIARNGRNAYGDPAETMYLGGTPLYDERTGKEKDRYAYILERHPELKDDGPGTR